MLHLLFAMAALTPPNGSPPAMSSTTPSRPAPILRVSANKRFLQYANGKPFFYLGDTAWELFHRLNREEADHYLTVRAQQGFTVIQAVVLAEHGFDRPNAYGALPLRDNDPTKPNEAYFEHVDAIVRKAESLGMFVGMLPTWGDKWNKKWGAGPELFNPSNARAYGEFLGRRYRDRAIIWILGGDRPIETPGQRAVIEAMAEGLRAGDGGRHLMTFHPCGQRTSAEWFQDAPWLSFNMLQSGHTRDRDNWRSIAEDYARTPTKPCLDGEPGYEDHPSGFDPKNGYMDETDTRKFAYWAVFAGALGHTYGCHDIWQFLSPAYPPISWARTPWPQALTLPGARQVGFVRKLMLSRPFFTRIPDPSLIVGDPGKGADHIEATRAADGSYAMVYFAWGTPARIDLAKVSGTQIAAWWFDPRTGQATRAGVYPAGGPRRFEPPTSGRGCDWVLVLDDASRKFPPPGQSR